MALSIVLLLLLFWASPLSVVVEATVMLKSKLPPSHTTHYATEHTITSNHRSRIWSCFKYITSKRTKLQLQIMHNMPLISLTYIWFNIYSCKNAASSADMLIMTPLQQSHVSLMQDVNNWWKLKIRKSIN